MQDTIELSVYLICTVKPEAGDRWVTGCPALDLFSQGETEEEAKRCLEEAIGLWIEDCLERGTLDEALQEVGFHRSMRQRSVPETSTSPTGPTGRESSALGSVLPARWAERGRRRSAQDANFPNTL